MYQLKDGSYINANKITHFIELQETKSSDKKYLVIISDGTKRYVDKEDYEALMDASGTVTYSDVIVTDKLSVGDIEDIEQAINNIEDFSDVKDVVGTYADLMAYDTSKLNDEDIVEVLDDENEDHRNTMYRWHKDTETWELIGALGPYYTKGEADAKYVKEVKFELEEPTEGETTVSGKILYVRGDDSEQEVIDLSVLRDLLLTPSPETPDVSDTENTDSDLTLMVSDPDGNAVKMTLEQLRQRFITSSDVDQTNFEDAQNGQFIYEEIPDEGEGE